MEPQAVSAESFSFLQLFLKADWVIKGVMIGLALLSLVSWAVILDKFVRFGGLNRQANAFEDKVGSGRPLEEVAQEAGNSKHPLPRLLNAALREWRDTRAKGAIGDTQTALLIQRIDRVLDSNIARESQKAEEGLGTLAIVATASPFIGLFGTVWGIMNAFKNIALEQNTSLPVVAPAIAEALFATALGLIAAIPAYIAYNKFSTDAGKFAGRLESFADDLSTAIQRRLAEKV
ncbi:MAG TPA: protein TolQ [Caulobacter sp.]|nr:protein TolQ [Caulobacter sp.]